MREGFTGKRCPKCGGNIYLDRDYQGWYEKCLQCGYTCNLKSIIEIKEEIKEEVRKEAKKGESGSIR